MKNRRRAAPQGKPMDVTIIVATNRPKWAANCLHQIENQRVTDFTYEPIVVAEGSPQAFSNLSKFYTKPKYHFKETQGLAGAYAKDEGILQAGGEYVVFWDDDNVYSQPSKVS